MKIRFKLEDLENSLVGPNKDFIKYILTNNISIFNDKNISIIFWGDEKKINNIKVYFKDINYNINSSIYNFKSSFKNDGITIDLINKEDDDYLNTSRFKIYYEKTQDSYISGLIQLISFIVAHKNNKLKDINGYKEKDTSSNSRQSKLKQIKSNREAYKKAKNKVSS